MFSLFIVEPVYICYMNCLTVTYRPIGSGVQLFVSLSQLLYNLTHVTIINDLLTHLLAFSKVALYILFLWLTIEMKALAD